MTAPRAAGRRSAAVRWLGGGHPSSTLTVALAVAAAVETIGGVATLVRHDAAAASPVNRGTIASARGLTGPGASAARAGAGASAPPPVSLEIPSIGVRTSLVDLGLQADGTLAVPDDFGVAGWWSGGSRPGVAGPAVIVGHVDSYRSAAVFYRLRELAPGASVLVHRKDGSTVTFAVEGLRQFPKDRLPTAAVYGPTAVPSLRLITCGGTFDRSRHRYEDNVVAFAHLVPSAAAPAAVTGPAPAP